MTFRHKLRAAAVLATCIVPASLVAAGPAAASGQAGNPDVITRHFLPVGFDPQPEPAGVTRVAVHILGP